MKTTFISTLTLWKSTRSALPKMQADLAKANEEIATGRYADIGRELGYRVGGAISLRQERAELDALKDGNATVSLRLGASKVALDQVRSTAQDFLATLVSAPSRVVDGRAIADAGKRNLQAFTAQMNKAVAGQFIFAGTNVKQQPVAEYESVPTSAAKSAVNTAFIAKFGFPQTDPAVSTINPNDMRDFLRDNFAPLFEEPAWSTTWSSATSQNIESRISPSEKIKTSANANEAGFRKLAMAYTMASDLALPNLSEETQAVVVSKMIEVLGAATTDVVQIQANLGAAEKKVTEANERISLQRDLFDKKIIGLENVDPAEAKTRVDTLMTQIQMSYSLTSQLRQLSLINYI